MARFILSLVMIGLIVSALIIGGCVTQRGNGVTPPVTVPNTATTATPAPSMASPVTTSPVEAPQVYIVSPEFDSGVPHGDVMVKVQVTGFRLVDPEGRKNSPGEGHLIYYRDVVPPTDPLKPAFSAPGTYASTPNTTYTWHNIGTDTHTFAVQLVNNDDTPLNPPIVAANDVTVV
jgi:hypothetical protein